MPYRKTRPRPEEKPNETLICDAIRTPIGRYAGALAGVRADDLGAIPMQALMQRNPDVDWSQVDDVIGCQPGR